MVEVEFEFGYEGSSKVGAIEINGFLIEMLECLFLSVCVMQKFRF